MDTTRYMLTILMLACTAASLRAQRYELVWHDEFDADGRPDTARWVYEEGFVRNHEAQWYSRDNAWVQDGLLVIEARPCTGRPNPWYREDSTDWRFSRPEVTCTSACITTQGRYSFCYGSLQVRARIPVGKGAWPAIWTLGCDMEWPSNGEIDLMEFYRIDGLPVIMANAAWGTDHRFQAHWNSKATPFSHFLELNPDWASEFHVWRMDWTDKAILLYLDDELLNSIDLAATTNGRLAQFKNPFRHPHYILLNLAVGGDNGGEISPEAWPMRYEIDYVRVYQLKE